MLKDLKLEEFHPSKISLLMINEIIQNSTDEKVTEKSIPWLLLRKFMNLNYKGRDEDLNALYDYDEDEDERSEKNNIHLHPLDVFLLTYLCCDPILQQELLSKMFFCRLAVPFIYRNLEDKLNMSKWAFRKIVISRKRGEEWVENDALSELVKIVSFIRVGPQTHDTVSKSNMINELISFPPMSTFFNRKTCVSYETEKLITNGMVEASWFVPSNRSYDNSPITFQDVVMFLNLRGNSLEHDEEVRLVFSISDVIVVHIDANILTKSNIVLHLEKMHSFGKLMIYGIDCKKGEHGSKAKFNCFKEKIKENDVSTKCIEVAGGIDLALVKRFKRYILDFLSKNNAKQFSEVISNIKFVDDSFSVDGYRMAKDIVDIIDKQSGNYECPFFPLQDTTWKKLCECTKELFRSKSKEDEDIWRKLQKKILQEQFNWIKKSRTLQHFARNRLSQGYDNRNTNETLFFIAWIKSLMEERLRTVNKYKQKQFKLAPCYEHFIREMGQAFSIVDTFPRENIYKWDARIFPSFVSSMLQFGFPFELMDGDTGMVPLQWVKAVFSHLKEDIGDTTVYVISVLGIQSSGKSTLLNTMFGLHFAVSAGKCTRGVFMQLIKVEDRTLPFNYLLILDTEGIQNDTTDRRKFENELATFAIGLGNITILNIKGENTSQIINFLQIAVHACLRLKMANNNIKLEQRCVFVHQNVSAHDAFDRLQEERDKLIHTLDTVVKEAATSLDRSDIFSFKQVIGINADKDVWYFPDLWQGEPPMATVTPGYSTKVLSLKRHILHSIAKQHGTSYSVNETYTRIEDFCKGILTDNFLFSFQNSLEIRVYREMDSEFQIHTWELELITDELISKTSDKIAQCTEEKLECVCVMSCEKLKKTLENHFTLRKEEFLNFIETNRFRDIMKQYKGCKTLQLNELRELLITKGQNKIQRLKKRHQSSLDQISKMKKHMRELKEKAQDLVAKCKTNELSEKDTIYHFNEMWVKWLDGIYSIKDENMLSVDKIVQKKMFEMFHLETPWLQDEIKKYNLDEYRTMKTLVNSIPLNQLHDDHITSPFPIDVDQSKDAVLLKLKLNAFKTINIIMKKIDTYISSLQKEYLPFKESYATIVFRFLIEDLYANNSNTSNSFSLTTKLRAKLAVHIRMYIGKVFTDLNKEWMEKNDLKKQTESERQTYLGDFLGMVKDKTIEMRMANLFVKKMQKFITETVQQNIPADVVKSIIPGIYNTKHNLMIGIMTYLVHKSDFDEYRQFLDDSYLYALDYLTELINVKMFITKGHDNEYTKIAEKHITIIFEKIEESIDHATKYFNENCCSNKQKICLWYKLFEQKFNTTFMVPNGIFLTDIEDEIVDIYNYKKLIIGELKQLRETIKDQFKNQTAENVKWAKSPYQKVFKQLWGCRAECPFCKESCKKNYQHRGETHACIEHRPPALWGIRRKSTKMMATMPCNCLVSSSETFLCDAIFDSKHKCPGKCEGKCKLPYSKYKTLIPEWTIETIPVCQPPKYWRWFMSKFQKELCEAYRYMPSENNSEELSFQDAIDSLT
ncbi:interferon-induced very large GTPase 1-like [Mytilus edulis]|uniref:interferon-induced very large GTPase 1-like n=1 Tax=Mytilus edulis TaxID=6550 RepID=UPI0039F0C79D